MDVERENGFNAIVEECAGAGRNAQEDYLMRVVMKVMTQRYGESRPPELRDANVLRKHGIGDIKNVLDAIKVLDAYYLAVAKSLLDDDDHDLDDIRVAVKDWLVGELNRKRKIQEEAGITSANNC